MNMACPEGGPCVCPYFHLNLRFSTPGCMICVCTHMYDQHVRPSLTALGTVTENPSPIYHPSLPAPIPFTQPQRASSFGPAGPSAFTLNDPSYNAAANHIASAAMAPSDLLHSLAGTRGMGGSMADRPSSSLWSPASSSNNRLASNAPSWSRTTLPTSVAVSPSVPAHPPHHQRAGSWTRGGGRAPSTGSSATPTGSSALSPPFTPASGSSSRSASAGPDWVSGSGYRTQSNMEKALRGIATVERRSSGKGKRSMKVPQEPKGTRISVAALLFDVIDLASYDFAAASDAGFSVRSRLTGNFRLHRGHSGDSSRRIQASIILDVEKLRRINSWMAGSSP
ncbi:hypothetical protein JCM1840_006039 [Sporobolomyces johnsonii]